MSHYNSSRHPSQSQVSDLSKIGTEDTFMVDLESKVDSLKNISTNINKELLKSKAHLSSLSKTFDSASLSLKGTLSNMSRIAKGYGSKLPLWALGLIVAFVLLLLYMTLKKIVFNK